MLTNSIFDPSDEPSRRSPGKLDGLKLKHQFIHHRKGAQMRGVIQQHVRIAQEKHTLFDLKMKNERLHSGVAPPGSFKYQKKQDMQLLNKTAQPFRKISTFNGGDQGGES